MKQILTLLNIFFLLVSFQSHFAFADIFSMTNKDIRIEVVDYRDFLDDIIFWIHHTKDTPVVAQKLINDGIYPISVTIYNDSDKSIKIMKNAIGGLSTAKDQEVAQLYQYDIFARVIKKASLGAFLALATVGTFDILSEGNAQLSLWKVDLVQYCENWYKKIMYTSSSTGALIAGIMRWSETTTTNALISQVFQSHLLSEESIIDSGCSMTFLLFASHAPSGYTLKIPIFDEQDNQIISFSCPFSSAIAA